MSFKKKNKLKGVFKCVFAHKMLSTSYTVVLTLNNCITEQLEDKLSFVFTRWNGGGTPVRQNTEFMYVSFEYSDTRVAALFTSVVSYPQKCTILESNTNLAINAADIFTNVVNSAS